MGYRVCISTCRIHAIGESNQPCLRGKGIQSKNRKDFLTKDEAEAFVREKHKKPQYCKVCKFTEALQAEANR